MKALPSVLGATVVVVVFGFVALALCEAASSPDPAAVLALYGSALRAIGRALLARVLRHAAAALGMWRRTAAEPGKPCYAPTRIGAWLGWQHAKNLERFADEDAVRLFRPEVRQRSLDEAKSCRGCLEGAFTWPCANAGDAVELRDGHP
jgi:hypothetical protein